MSAIMISKVLQQSVMITGFIFMMMLLIEYWNVLTSGNWQNHLRKGHWRQYLFAALMGAIPGCLGAFTVVSLYTHGVVTLGALVTAMIATSGDEAFVMLALIPDKFLLITAIIALIGLTAGWLTDLVFRRHTTQNTTGCTGFNLHEKDECICFSSRNIIPQLKSCSPTRGFLLIFTSVITLFFIFGILGPPQWNWVRVTLVIISTFGLFVVVTVPDHFLLEHLWNHVTKHHLPNIFLWTFGALLFLAYLSQYINVESWIQRSQLVLLIAACLIGLIPESGPHLVFVTMYAQGVLPLSILLASSIVQDGHGMLPMLAHSRKGFILVKAINLTVGLMVGFLGYWSCW